MSNSIVDLVNSQRNRGNQTPMQNNPQIQQLKNVMHQIQSSPNPQAVLQNILMQNPNMQNIMSMLSMNKMSPEQFARMLAQQKGIDINALINELNT